MAGHSPMRRLSLAVPLILGVLSLLCFALYFYSANHAPYSFIDAILLGPPLALAGIVVSVVNRKRREANPALWGCGLGLCLVGAAYCLLVFIALALFASALADL